MALMMGSLYEALVDGGTQEAIARKAAEEVADYTKQLSDIRSDLSFIKALLGVAVSGVLALLIKAFFV